MKLLVLGNGFDLWLGLPTEFSDYKKFLEENGNKYSNYYNLLRVIANENQDYEWNRLEDDMLSWLIKNINKTNLLTELLSVDIKKAFQEKNNSLSEWINYINKKYKNELEQLQKFLKDRCPIINNGAFIWTFNYMIDYYKPWHVNEYKDLRIQTKIYDDVNRRMVSQCHFFVYGESIKDIKFGANYKLLYKLLFKKILNFDNIVESYNDDYKCLIITLTKFCPLSIFKNIHEKFSNPIRNMYEDIARNLPCFLWTQKKQISEICSLGFSFEKQDDIYFSNEAYSPLKHCNNFKYTYFKDDERDKIKEKLKNIIVMRI